jgi:hypothetical protein
MKRIIYVFFLLTFFSFFVNRTLGQPIPLWNYTINITPNSDIAYDVANDSSNNIIVVGYDYTPGTYQWRIMKFYPDGRSMWNYTDNSTRYTIYPQSVAVDNESNIIAVGLDTPVYGDSRWRIMKLAPDKTSLWNYTDNISTGSDKAQSVAVDNESNIIVAGWDNSTGNLQWRIMKLDKDKNSLWNYTDNPSSYDEWAYGVAIDKQNNIIAVGFDNKYGIGDSDWRIMKLDKDKNEIWNYTPKLSSGSDVAWDVAVDGFDNIIVVGSEFVNGADYRWKIMKIAPDRTSLWNYTDNPKSNDVDRAYGVDIDNNNNIIVVGTDRNLTSPVNNQWRIIKIAPDGTSLWNHTINISSGRDEAWSVAVDKENNFIVVGYDANTTPANNEWTIMKFSDVPVCGDGKFEPWKGEECEKSLPNRDAPCPRYAKCNETCNCEDFRPRMLGCNYFDYCENGHVPNVPGSPCIFGMFANCWTAETDTAIITLINDTCQDESWANHTWMTCPNGTASCGNGYCETGETHFSCLGDCPS